MTATKLRRKHHKRHGRKKGGIHRHKFAACAKKCHGNRGCMSTCLRG